jgi:hypothetical protein
MENEFQKLKKIASKVAFEPQKKEQIRQNLLRFIAAHEAVHAVPTRMNFFSWSRLAIPAGAFALLLLAGGGTSLAAEYALPGDALYAFKTKVNEPFVAVLTVSESAKAEWQTTVALRRLEEADTLALQGKLTPEAKTEIESHFETSAGKAAATLASLDRKGDGASEKAGDLSATFESSLKAHADILAKVDGGKETEDVPPQTAAFRATSLPVQPKEETDSLIRKIRSTIALVSKTRGDAEVKVAEGITVPDNSRSAANKIDAARKIIADVASLVAKSNLSAQASLDASARLTIARTLITEAGAKFDAKAYGEAFQLAGKALRKAQETRVLVSAQHEAEAGKSTATMGVASGASLNLLTANPQDEEGDHAIMDTSVTSTLNVDGNVEAVHP